MSGVSATAQKVRLSAKALGDGTDFLTMYFSEETLKLFVKAPDDLKLVCAAPVGVPEEWPEMPEKKSLDEFIVCESF